MRSRRCRGVPSWYARNAAGHAGRRRLQLTEFKSQLRTHLLQQLAALQHRRDAVAGVAVAAAAVPAVTQEAPAAAVQRLRLLCVKFCSRATALLCKFTRTRSTCAA